CAKFTGGWSGYFDYW
nr:immunoglobulin heavy chain junction region [Macaca mulatta]